MHLRVTQIESLKFQIFMKCSMRYLLLKIQILRLNLIRGVWPNFLKKYNIKEGVFIDDIKENLKTAKNFGLSTIWITDEMTHHSFIDRKIEKISDLLTF